MAKKKEKPEKEQARRFKEAAREAGADETDEAFERAFRKIAPPKKESNRAGDT